MYPDFKSTLFYQTVSEKLLDLEFGQRQSLIADALHANLHVKYEECLEVFRQILGPELPTNEGSFTEGYWLWPIGKFVEIYGLENLDASISFSKELTKRFTSEYCMRPLIEAEPEKVISVLIEWSQDENKRVRRLASECIRIRLPWSKKMRIALEYFESYKQILSNLKNDPDKYIQKSVANNLNDLYKESPEHFREIIQAWEAKEKSKETEWIIRHASRNVE